MGRRDVGKKGKVRKGCTEGGRDERWDVGSDVRRKMMIKM